MTRTQILALFLGASLAVVAGVLAWQGLLPGVPPLQPRNVSPAPLAAKGTDKPAPAPSPAKPAQIATVEAAKPQPVIPQFDTVRVEPSGETVVAGHGAPNAKIALMAGDKVIGAVQAGDLGDFVIVPQALPPGNYVLSLRSESGTAAPVQSRQTITVSVPAKGQKGVVVALTEPGKPSQLLVDPTAQSASAEKPSQDGKAETPPRQSAEPKPAVAIKTAEVDKGGFYAAGFAPPGTHLRIYLNGSFLTDVIADAKGRWSLTIGKGMTAGHYVVRADAIGTDGKVIARAEVPFDVPVAVAEAGALAPKPEPKPATDAKPSAGAVASLAASVAAASTEDEGGKSDAPKAADADGHSKDGDGKPKLAAAASPAPDPSRAVLPEIGTARVTRGDSLWRISRKTLGHGVRYTLIYQANASQIRDPNLIYPGQVFVLPHSD